MLSDDPKNYNPYVNPKKIDSFVKWASIVWFYVTFMAAIVRGGKMTGLDMLGVVVGTTTAFGYWLKFSWPKVVVEAVFAGKVLLALGIVTLLLAWPLGYLGFV
ncbi:hypothetical protein [Agrobacterium tumefaciens]|uniref:hypothetical protein n=1 Tax=Agrobacterium tumefaciens TaxID=358 RepID=UPI0010484B33|nr:hypothetical protein [Agrobacterium tumefaciens]TCV45241.1 hypothetical protein EDB97_1225 [Agrobacterium tumefaciens]